MTGIVDPTSFWIVTIGFGVALVMLARVRDSDFKKARRQYIHAIKEIEYLYQRLNLKYETPPYGFGSTLEVKQSVSEKWRKGR